MKYNAPYGVADPNAPYINGNPATGTQGSIPPAESIEYPQREIANLIADTGFTPANTDLHQLTRGVRQGVNYLAATAVGGNVNVLQAANAVAPALLAYVAGLRLNVAIPANNTGPVTLAVDGLAARPLKRASGADLGADDLRGGMVASLVYDGTNFQLTNFQGFTSTTTNNNTFNVNIPYIADTGTVNALVAVFSPAITSLPPGLLIIVKLANTLTGPATIAVNAQPVKNLHRPDGTNMQLNDAFTGEMLLLSYDGVAFQVCNQLGLPPLPVLLANRTWYVNASTGNDSSLDGTSATVSGVHGPFRTVGRAMLEIVKYNQNGYNQTVNIANGTYVEQIHLPTINGAGEVFITGNHASPSSVLLQGPTGHGCISVEGHGYTLDGLKIQSGGGSSIAGDPMNGIEALAPNCSANLMSLHLGTCVGTHILCAYGGQFSFDDATITIAGGASAHMVSAVGGSLLNVSQEYDQAQWPALVIPASVNFSGAFIVVSSNGYSAIGYKSITGAANVTGKRYSVDLNGIINARGTTYPGNSAGTTATGGQVT